MGVWRQRAKRVQPQAGAGPSGACGPMSAERRRREAGPKGWWADRIGVADPPTPESASQIQANPDKARTVGAKPLSSYKLSRINTGL